MRKGRTDECDDREKEYGYEVKPREGEKGRRRVEKRERGKEEEEIEKRKRIKRK